MRRSAALTGVLILLPAIAAAASAFSAAPYDPSLDGWRQLRAAGRKAATDNRHVLIIVGGNWCK